MRRFIGAILWCGSLCGPFLLACAAEPPPGTGPDVGVRDPDTDASAADGGLPSPIDAAPTEGTEARADNAFAGCLDGDDADRDRQLDCDDDDCDVAPVCCVGATSGACCTPAVPVLDLTLADCVSGCAAVPFGAAVTDADGMRPSRGDADDGVILPTAIDVRNGAVTLSARITSPDADRALDVVAFGLLGGPPAGRVLPVVAAQVNGATREVAILVGETVVRRASIVGTGEVTYTLTISPEGLATLSGGAETLSVSAVPIQGALDVVVFGRTEGAGPTTTVRGISVAADDCHVPAALALSPLVLVDEAGAFVAGTEENPSLARDAAGVRYLAFDAVRRADPTRRGVFVAVESVDGTFVVRNPRVRETQPVLGLSADVEEFTDPDLALEDGRWVLYVAGESNGREAIYRTATTGADLLDFAAPMRLTFEILDVSLDSPTRGPDAERLYARLTDATGSRIVELVSTADGTAAFEGALADGICGVDDDCADLSARDTRYILAARGGSAFDADEVDAPAHVVVGGVHRLYYAGRRGTRWATGLVVSEDGEYWRRLSDTTHAPDVVASAAEPWAPLGTRSPSVLVTDDAVTIVVEGYRGTRTQLLIGRQLR